VRLLPGARELLARLTRAGVPWAVATSGLGTAAEPALKLLEVPAGVPVVTRDQVERAKPDPDLFLAAAERLGADVADAVVVGDSVWDLLAARRARALGIGLLSGGYGREELERAGAYRVYDGLRRPGRPAAAPRRGRGAYALITWCRVLPFSRTVGLEIACAVCEGERCTRR
jgi:phosphoglycolate phosphatase-like HAD superfamily hydrolase